MEDLYLDENILSDIKDMIEMKKMIDDLNLIHHGNGAVTSFMLMIDNEYHGEMGSLAANLFKANDGGLDGK